MTQTDAQRPVASTWVEHIPVVWLAPAEPSGKLAIWVPYATGTKEAMLPYLQELAAAGFVAVSFDPWQHGERYIGDPDARGVARVMDNYPYFVWPFFGQSALESLRVLDWAIATFGIAPPCYIGGISMGGVIAVAAAGLDARIGCVGGIICTPDWLVPGMHYAGKVVAPGQPDAYARFFYDQMNPLTHLSGYAHAPAMTFECGGADDHMQPDGALRFQHALRETYQAHPDRFRVNLHPGVAHETIPAMWQNCVAWFLSH